MKIISTLLLSLLLAACGGASQSAAPSTPAPHTATSPAPAPTDDDPSCPVTVPGTSVSVEDTNTGAALVFVTTGDAAELRRRVGSMATMHNEQHGAMGPLPTGNEDAGHAGHDMHAMHGDHSAHGGHAGHDMSGGEHAGHAGGMIGVHSKAAAEDIAGGARLVFIAAPNDVAKLQDELRMHAQHFAAGTCQMSH